MEKKLANDYQVGGEHYRGTQIQHWDYAASNEFDYFQGQVTKYVTRWKKKNGIADLEKALHFLTKYIEVEKSKQTSLPEAGRISAIPYPKGASITASAQFISEKTGQKYPFGYDARDDMGESI